MARSEVTCLIKSNPKFTEKKSKKTHKKSRMSNHKKETWEVAAAKIAVDLVTLGDFLANQGKVPKEARDAEGYRHYPNMESYYETLEDWLVPKVKANLESAPQDLPVSIKTRVMWGYYAADVKVGDVTYLVMVHE